MSSDKTNTDNTDNNEKIYEPPNKKQKFEDDIVLKNIDKLEESIKLEDNKDDFYVMKNLCVECGIDMGECNPRQYCAKTYCMYK
jgi:hypothetical protein